MLNNHGSLKILWIRHSWTLNHHIFKVSITSTSSIPKMTWFSVLLKLLSPSFFFLFLVCHGHGISDLSQDLMWSLKLTLFFTLDFLFPSVLLGWVHQGARLSFHHPWFSGDPKRYMRFHPHVLNHRTRAGGYPNNLKRFSSALSLSNPFSLCLPPKRPRPTRIGRELYILHLLTMRNDCRFQSNHRWRFVESSMNIGVNLNS